MSIRLAILCARELNIRIHIMQLFLHLTSNIAFSFCFSHIHCRIQFLCPLGTAQLIC